jgi:opacity protein-like surface antigen
LTTITKLRNRLKFTSTLVAATFLFSTLSSITKAEDRFFYQLGAGYVEGNSHSTYLGTGNSFAGNIQGYRLDFGLGLSSEINKIKVDYILSYSPDAFGNQVDTKNSCPAVAYECRVNIKDSLDLGVKFYLPSNANKITPTIYFGVSNADIQLKSLNRTGSAVTMMSHQRNWGATAGLGLNYDLNNNTAISLDYSWTAYEKNEEQIDTALNRTNSRPEINSLSLKLKKYF